MAYLNEKSVNTIMSKMIKYSKHTFSIYFLPVACGQLNKSGLCFPLNLNMAHLHQIALGLPRGIHTRMPVVLFWAVIVMGVKTLGYIL